MGLFVKCKAVDKLDWALKKLEICKWKAKVKLQAGSKDPIRRSEHKHSRGEREREGWGERMLLNRRRRWALARVAGAVMYLSLSLYMHILILCVLCIYSLLSIVITFSSFTIYTTEFPKYC